MQLSAPEAFAEAVASSEAIASSCPEVFTGLRSWGEIFLSQLQEKEPEMGVGWSMESGNRAEDTGKEFETGEGAGDRQGTGGVEQATAPRGSQNAWDQLH